MYKYLFYDLQYAISQVPAEIQEKVDKYLIASYELGCDDHFDSENAPYEIIGVLPQTQFEITHNGKPHQVTVYDNDHTVPCRSYGFKELVKSLKSEYKGLASNELGKLRKSGIILDDFSWLPRFIYIGDTTEKVFEMDPDIFSYKSIIVECTFIEDDDLDNANRTKHCHWKKLRNIIEEHKDNTFILYHFSCRYTVDHIKFFFTVENGNYLENVHIWLSS